MTPIMQEVLSRITVHSIENHTSLLSGLIAIRNELDAEIMQLEGMGRKLENKGEVLRCSLARVAVALEDVTNHLEQAKYLADTLEEK